MNKNVLVLHELVEAFELDCAHGQAAAKHVAHIHGQIQARGRWVIHTGGPVR